MFLQHLAGVPGVRLARQGRLGGGLVRRIREDDPPLDGAITPGPVATTRGRTAGGAITPRPVATTCGRTTGAGLHAGARCDDVWARTGGGPSRGGPSRRRVGAQRGRAFTRGPVATTRRAHNGAPVAGAFAAGSSHPRGRVQRGRSAACQSGAGRVARPGCGELRSIRPPEPRWSRLPMTVGTSRLARRRWRKIGSPCE